MITPPRFLILTFNVYLHIFLFWSLISIRSFVLLSSEMVTNLENLITFKDEFFTFLFVALQVYFKLGKFLNKKSQQELGQNAVELNF